MAADIMFFINQALSAVGSWFLACFSRSGMVDLYIAMLFIVLSVRFIIVPFVGAATFTAASDRVRSNKERSRYKGNFERNQKGKYAK